MPLSVGILLRDSAVEVTDVEVKGAGVGIEIRGTASPVLRANTIRDCAAEGLSDVSFLAWSMAWSRLEHACSGYNCFTRGPEPLSRFSFRASVVRTKYCNWNLCYQHSGSLFDRILARH